jgi:hypothetical protein
LGCVWISTGKISMEEPGNAETTTAEVFSLSGLYCHRKGRQLFPIFLQSVVHALGVHHPHNELYIVTNCHEDLLFEKAGFRPSK